MGLALATVSEGHLRMKRQSRSLKILFCLFMVINIFKNVVTNAVKKVARKAHVSACYVSGVYGQ